MGTSTKLFATGFYGIAKTLGMVIFSFWLVERVGRRQGLIWGALVGSIPMWYIGGYVMKADPAGAAAAGRTSRDGWGYLAMGKLRWFAFLFTLKAYQTPSLRVPLWSDLLRDLAGHHLGVLL